MKRYVPVKYTLDFLLAAVLLLLSFWAMALIALAIKLDDPKSPIMYNATRIGRGLKPFKMYKFRTMRPVFEGVGRVTSDRSRGRESCCVR